MRAESNWTLTSWVELAIVAAGFLILHWVLRHGRTSPLLRFTALFAWIVTCIAAFHQYLGWHFFPQAGRYKVEVDWAWSVLLVFALLPVLRRLPRVVPVMLCLALLGAAYGRVVSHRRFAKQLARDGTKLDQSIERRAALWAEQNLPGRRMLFVGSMAQWANLFSDGPQLTGGSYPTTYNDVQRLASETVVWGTAAEPESFVVWLKAFGVHAVAVPGPKSPEFWKPFPNPPIWEPLLPVLWREDDTTIYWIPHGSNGLARAVPKSSLVHVAPRNGHDTSALRRYVAALNEPTAGRTAFRWISRNRAIVRADTGPGEVASVQINYHPGWKARCGRRTLPVHRDGLGLIWIGEACNEDIELTYDGGFEARLLRWLSVLTALGCLGWWVSEAVWLATHSSSD
jgi:hypothetical protein